MYQLLWDKGSKTLFICPIIVVRIAYKFLTLNVSTIMGHKSQNIIHSCHNSCYIYYKFYAVVVTIIMGQM